MLAFVSASAQEHWSWPLSSFSCVTCKFDPWPCPKFVPSLEPHRFWRTKFCQADATTLFVFLFQRKLWCPHKVRNHPHVKGRWSRWAVAPVVWPEPSNIVYRHAQLAAGASNPPEAHWRQQAHTAWRLSITFSKGLILCLCRVLCVVFYVYDLRCVALRFVALCCVFCFLFSVLRLCHVFFDMC